MIWKVRKMLSNTRNLLLLLLAVSVFSWGLQAKLALYSATSTTGSNVAKLSTERHSIETVRSLEERDETPHPDKLTVPTFCGKLLATHCFRTITEEAEISLTAPNRVKRTGIYTFHRPPPLLS